MTKAFSRLLSHSFFKSFLITLLIGATFYSQSVYAISVNVIDLKTMLDNLAKTVPGLMQLVTAIAYVMGMIFIIKGLLGLKDHGDARSSGGKGGIKVPITWIAVGTMLLYLPSSVEAGLTTFWSDPAPFSYLAGSDDQWIEFVNSVFLIVQLIGTIAFIRGLVLLAHSGEGHQQGGVGKAITHIVGGILLINLYQFLQAVFSTLGLGQL